MTGKELNKEDDCLARLYREQGDIEPGPDVDQRIRARAKADTRLSRLPPPAHWLGGVAVAASLFVVVSIVTNIQPPEAELPPAPHAPVADDVAGSATGPAVEAEPRAPAAKADRTGEDDFDSAPLQRLQLRERSQEEGRSAELESAEPESRAESDISTGERVLLDPELGLSDRIETRPLSESMSDVEGRLWLIEQFIAIGNAERARAEINEFRERYPEREIPARTVAALERLESSSEQN